jgi:hypothetical protein
LSTPERIPKQGREELDRALTCVKRIEYNKNNHEQTAGLAREVSRGPEQDFFSAVVVRQLVERQVNPLELFIGLSSAIILFVIAYFVQPKE